MDTTVKMVQETTKTLGWMDYTVIIIVLAISSSIGVYYKLTGGRQRTWEEYFIANRAMSIIPVGIGVMVSYVSAIAQLGESAEIYEYGTQYCVIILAYGMAVPVASYGYLPVFFKLEATSIYEYIERRFGVKARLVTSLICWLQLVMYTAVVLYAPALAIEATTQLSQTLTIVGIGLVCSSYSTLGGMKAVLMTDVFQCILMFSSIFLVIGSAVYNVGGFAEIWRIADEGGRIIFDSVSLDLADNHTWWCLIVGGFFSYLPLYAANQVQIQRLLTLKELRVAQGAYFLAWVIEAVLLIGIVFSGLAIYSRYYNCDPLMAGKISSSDQLMPFYVMDTLGGVPGLPGLFVAGIFSGGLSTMSAALNSLAAITLEDYVRPGYKKFTGDEISRERSIVIAKVFVFAYGLLCMALAFLVQYLGGILQATLTIFGIVGGPILGIFTLGMFTQSATQFGAITGLVSGFVITLWIGFGQPRPSSVPLAVSIDGCASINSTIESVITTLTNDTEAESYFFLYRISYMWYGAISFLLTMVIGLLVSNLKRVVLRETQPELDADLFTPWLAKRIRARRLVSSSQQSVVPTLSNKTLTYEFNCNEKREVFDTNDAY